MRMRGKGMPALRRGNSGDQIVEVQVETPTNLNKKQKELLEAFLIQVILVLSLQVS